LAGETTLSNGAPQTAPRVPLAAHINYSIGTLAPSALVVFSRSFLLFFYSQAVGLNPWLAGIALTVGRLWDAVSDPLMGAISDRTRSRMGRRRPYIIFGSIPMALTYVAMWTPPFGWSQTSLFIYLMVTDIAFNICVTVVTIPYTSLGAELTTDYHERTKVTAIRMLFYQVGWFVGAVGVKLNQYLIDTAATVGGVWSTLLSFRQGYAMSAVIFGIETIVTVSWSGYWVKENAAYLEEQEFRRRNRRVSGSVVVRVDRLFGVPVHDRLLVLPGWRHAGDEQQLVLADDADLLHLVPGRVVLDVAQHEDRQKSRGSDRFDGERYHDLPALPVDHAVSPELDLGIDDRVRLRACESQFSDQFAHSRHRRRRRTRNRRPPPRRIVLRHAVVHFQTGRRARFVDGRRVPEHDFLVLLAYPLTEPRVKQVRQALEARRIQSRS
jgi:hypothetical protein